MARTEWRALPVYILICPVPMPIHLQLVNCPGPSGRARRFHGLFQTPR
jgi:hypothetical protein